MVSFGSNEERCVESSTDDCRCRALLLLLLIVEPPPIPVPFPRIGCVSTSSQSSDCDAIVMSIVVKVDINQAFCFHVSHAPCENMK